MSSNVKNSSKGVSQGDYDPFNFASILKQKESGDSIEIKELRAKLISCKDCRDEQKLLELSAMLTNLKLKKEVLERIKGVTTGDVLQHNDDSYVDLCSLVLIACSKNLELLVTVEIFNLNHLKKCFGYINQAIFVLQTYPLVNFPDLVAKSCVSLLSPLLKVIQFSKELKYENQSFLLKLVILLVCNGMNCTTLMEEITQQLVDHKQLLDESVSGINPFSFQWCGGVISIFKAFKTTDVGTFNLMEFVEHVLPFDVDFICSNFLSVLIELHKYHENLILGMEFDSVCTFLIIANRSKFHGEIICLFIIQQPELLAHLERLTFDSNCAPELKRLFSIISDICLDFGIGNDLIYGYLSSNDFQQLLVKDEEFPEFAFKVIYEVLDQNFKLSLENEPHFVQLLKLSLKAIVSRLKSTKSYTKLLHETEKSTFSISGILSYLSYILVSNVMKLDLFPISKKIVLPKFLEEIFSFSTIPPVSKSDFIFGDHSINPEESWSIKNNTVKDLFECISVTVEVQCKVTKFLASTQLSNGNAFHDVSGSPVNSKILNKFIELNFSSVIAIEILIKNCKNKIEINNGNTDDFSYDYFTFCDSIAELCQESIFGLTEIFGKYGVYCILRNLNDICLMDLQLVTICSAILTKLIKKEKIRDILIADRLCLGVFSQFLELFDDPDSKDFDILYELVPENKREKQTICKETEEYKKIFYDEEENTAEPTLETSSPKNAYSEMNINRISNFASVGGNQSQNEILMSPDTSPEINFREPFSVSNENYYEGATGAIQQMSLGNPEYSQVSSPPFLTFPTSDTNNYTQFAKDNNYATPNQVKFQESVNRRGSNFAGNYTDGLGITSPAQNNPSSSISPYHYQPSPDIRFQRNRVQQQIVPGETTFHSNNYNYNYTQASNLQSPLVPNTNRAQSVHVDVFESNK